jgi:hypothetical protein
MLKMEESPGMCMKTQDRKTKWPIISRAFRLKLRPFCENGRKSGGLLGRKCTDEAIVRANSRPKSVHQLIRPIDPSDKSGVVLDGGMIHWPDAPIVSPFHYVLAKKGG